MLNIITERLSIKTGKTFYEVPNVKNNYCIYKTFNFEKTEENVYG